SGRPKPRPRPGDLFERNVQPRARSGGSYRPVPFLLRVTPIQDPRVELRLRPANADSRQQLVATRLLCARSRPLPQVFLDTKECDRDCFEPEMPMGPIRPPAEPGFRPHRGCLCKL